MPWIGARTRHETKIIQVKVGGPERRFSVSEPELSEYLREIIRSITDGDSIEDYVGNKLTRALREDENAVYVDVEVHDTENYSFSGKTYLVREEVVT